MRKPITAIAITCSTFALKLVLSTLNKNVKKEHIISVYFRFC